MRAGTTVSVLAHGALLAWGVVSLTAHPFDARQSEAIPVALVSVGDVTSLPKATPPAPAPPPPAPLVPPPAPAPIPIATAEPKPVTLPQPVPPAKPVASDAS